MENISSRLWTCLSLILGSEEQVYIRRRVFAFWNNIDEIKEQRIIMSGSRAEGLETPGSDIDIMFVQEHISVSENPDDLEFDLIMITKDIKPGFVTLRSLNRQKIYNCYGDTLIKVHKGWFLSSVLFRDEFLQTVSNHYTGAHAHGPCSSVLSVSTLDVDLLVCFSCKIWPQIASEWIDRRRHYGWPSSDLIQDIVQDGCLLVPIGNPNSQESYLQWRISFSLAETKLVHSFNHTQFLCYGLLKLFLKHAINSNEQVKNKLCSYFLKTSLFYCIEEENIVWNQENFLNCFWTCLRRLLKWIRDEYCPNYFIKDNNMFEGKICGSDSKVLYDYLFQLYNNELDSLTLIPYLPMFHLFNIRINIAANTLCVKGFREYLCDMELLSRTSELFPIFSRKCHDTMIQMMQQTTNPNDRVILKLFHINCLLSFVPLSYKNIQTTITNKRQYRQIKGLKQFIINNCLVGDICTGMLMLATLCYLFEEYEKVVIIVETVLKKFKPYTLYFGHVKRFNCDHPYISKICGKNMTLNQKLAHGIFARVFGCILDYRFYPQEIKNELEQHSFLQTSYIPPVVYCNVLLCLSYYHMKCRNKMIYRLNELHIAAVYDNKFIDEVERQLANTLFQRCQQICENW